MNYNKSNLKLNGINLSNFIKQNTIEMKKFQ